MKTFFTQKLFLFWKWRYENRLNIIEFDETSKSMASLMSPNCGSRTQAGLPVVSGSSSLFGGAKNDRRPWKTWSPNKVSLQLCFEVIRRWSGSRIGFTQTLVKLGLSKKLGNCCRNGFKMSRTCAVKPFSNRIYDFLIFSELPFFTLIWVKNKDSQNKDSIFTRLISMKKYAASLNRLRNRFDAMICIENWRPIAIMQNKML